MFLDKEKFQLLSKLQNFYSTYFLFRMLKDLKSPQRDSNAWCTESDRLQLAEDTLAAVRRVRKEVVDSMRLLMKSAKSKTAAGMFELVEDMMRKTRYGTI